MKALPIVERELRVAARRPKLYRVRWVIALVAMIFGAWMLWISSRFRGAGMAGGQSLQFLGQFAFAFCLFSGVANTADSLSEEKREGTLGLLFLTDLKSHDIVLGKLLATSLGSIYGLLATIPVFALIILVGGVQGIQLLQLALALLNTLFFSLSAGLLVSALCQSQKSASNIAAFLMVFFWIAPRVVGEWLRYKTSATALADLVVLFSPWYMVESIFPFGTASGFWWSLLVTHVIAWVFLAGACGVLPRTWQDRTVESATGWRARLQHWGHGGLNVRKHLRRRLLDANPFLWLASRDRFRGAFTWLLMGGVVGGMAVVWWYFRPHVELLAACLIVSVLLHALIKLDFCSSAARRLGEERHSGTIELILSTPISVREILRGQWLALRRHYLGPVAAVVVLDLLMIGLLWVTGTRWEDFARSNYGDNGPARVLLLFGAINVMLVLDLVALGWVAMWTGLNARVPAHAPSYAVIPILLVPWTVIIGGFTTMAILRPAWMNQMQFWHLPAAWISLGLIVDVVAIAWARKRLHRDFREVATRRFQAPPAGLFSRMMGRVSSRPSDARSGASRKTGAGI